MLTRLIRVFKFEKWTTINSGSNKDTGRIARFTSDHQDKMHPDGCILVTTYTMMTFSGKRTAQSQAFMEKLVARDWGLLMMDEVRGAAEHHVKEEKRRFCVI